MKATPEFRRAFNSAMLDVLRRKYPGTVWRVRGEHENEAVEHEADPAPPPATSPAATTESADTEGN